MPFRPPLRSRLRKTRSDEKPLAGLPARSGGIWGGARATARPADRDLENTGAVEIEFVDLAVAEVVAPDCKLLFESLGRTTVYVRAGVGSDDMAHCH